jgi:hypothetical protein
MLNTMTPETTETTRYVVIRDPEAGASEPQPWVLVADTAAGKESDRCWMQADEAAESKYSYRVVHFANEAEAAQAVADCIVRWGLGFAKTAPRVVAITQTTHHEYRTFDVCEYFDAVGVK